MRDDIDAFRTESNLERQYLSSVITDPITEACLLNMAIKYVGAALKERKTPA